MRKYLLPEKGQYYKACLHCHTTLSDGAMTPEEFKKRFKDTSLQRGGLQNIKASIEWGKKEKKNG